MHFENFLAKMNGLGSRACPRSIVQGDLAMGFCTCNMDVHLALREGEPTIESYNSTNEVLGKFLVLYFCFWKRMKVCSQVDVYTCGR